jgi:hypothetical protein
MKFFDKYAKVGLGLALMVPLPFLSGCVGYVDPGYGGPAVGVAVDTGPYFYGDFNARGRDVHAFRDRGFASRGVAHGGGRRR